MALHGVGHARDAVLRLVVLRRGLERVEVLRGPVLVALERLAARGAELGRQEQVGVRVRLGVRGEGLLGLLELRQALEGVGAADDGDVRERRVRRGLRVHRVVDVERVLVAGRVVVGLRQAQAQRRTDLRGAELGDGRLELLRGERVHQRGVRRGVAGAQPVAPAVETGHDQRGDRQHHQRGLAFLHPPVPHGEQLGGRLHESGEVLVGRLSLSLDFFTHGLHLVPCNVHGTARPTGPASSRRGPPRAPRSG